MRRVVSLMLLICLCSLLGACGDSSAAETRTELDFTVVTPDQIPGELQQILGSKKEETFALTYTDGNYLYIAIGAGEEVVVIGMKNADDPKKVYETISEHING